jgi:hypothetical protein
MDISMDKNQISDWQMSLASTYDEFISQFIAFAPLLAGALALLIVGWMIAYILRLATRKLIHGFDTIFNASTKNPNAEQQKMKRSYAVIISNLAFWIVMVFFITAAANLLGWKMVSNGLASLINYLPNLVSGLLIILAGILLGNLAKSTLMNATNSVGINQIGLLARVIQLVILFTSLIIGIEQIGINVGFLTNALVVSIGMLFAGGALAFGLGAKDLIANIIGAQNIRKHCRIGEFMQIGAAEGFLIDVTQTSIVLDTEKGRSVVPAKLFQEHISSFYSESEPSVDPRSDSAEASVK